MSTSVLIKKLFIVIYYVFNYFQYYYNTGITKFKRLLFSFCYFQIEMKQLFWDTIRSIYMLALIRLSCYIENHCYFHNSWSSNCIVRCLLMCWLLLEMSTVYIIIVFGSCPSQLTIYLTECWCKIILPCVPLCLWLMSFVFAQQTASRFGALWSLT